MQQSRAASVRVLVPLCSASRRRSHFNISRSTTALDLVDDGLGCVVDWRFGLASRDLYKRKQAYSGWSRILARMVRERGFLVKMNIRTETPARIR